MTIHQTKSVRSTSSSSSWINFLLSLLFVVVSGQVSGAEVDTNVGNDKTTHQLALELIEWLNGLPGGYFNPKQEIRRVDIIDESSTSDDVYYGVFAKEFIAKGEVLNHVPWKYIINDEEETEKYGQQDNEDDEDTSLKCGTARNLAKEMKLSPDQSQYGPYIKYLLNQPDKIIPSSWSKEGRDMLEEVLGGVRHQVIPPQEATSWLEEDWLDSCNGTPNDDIGAKAAMLVVSRADDELLIPVYDMYNHRNGKYYNTHMKLNRGVSHQVTARRDIQPGEQIHNSYNMCDECGGRKDGYGTPEIYRDYGFVEDFPQRWDMPEVDVMFDLFKLDNGTVILSWDDGRKPQNEKEMEEAKRGLRKELKRLYKVRHMIWGLDMEDDGKPSIPEEEWDSIWEYHQAVVDAISYALNDLADDDEDEKVPITGRDGVCTIESCGGDHYDLLDDEPDDIAYNKRTCNNRELLRFPDYYTLEHLKTNYQVLNFAFREGDGDICMDLEDTLQICSCYRPHYHEFSAHFAARFIDNVKRIIFIGGGDSMLLHESLKYPSIEKVVGLELDQTVTRKAFKYFRTQPHFDDDRVEWWFGDATKSLLLLPKEYWGTFDLVLVDLSETVMAFSVTEDLDVFEALALLLKPDGVMVKNEYYMDEMSDTFDHTLQIYLQDNPKICSQAMAFGSNGADFFHQKVKDQDVETLLLPSVEDLRDRFDYFHDYRSNNALAQGKCNLSEKVKKDEQGKSAGILHVLDAENTTMALSSKAVEDMIYSVGKEEGFTPVSIPKTNPDGTNSNIAVVVFKEGYVLARIWSEYSYCALDIGLWGAFEKAEKFRNRLAEKLDAKTLSQFRVVVGGMYDSSTWRDDVDTIGPQIVQRRNCDPPEEEKEFSDEAIMRMIVDETTNLAASNKLIVGVICGETGKDECLSIDALEKSSKVSKVVPLYTCPGLVEAAEDSDAERLPKMFECEAKIVDSLGESLDEDEDLDMVVLDPSTPHVMGQIMNSILSVPRYMEHFMNDFNVMVALSTDVEENWQRNFLERYRKDVLYDPLSRAELMVKLGEESMEIGIVSCGDLAIFHNLSIMEKKLLKRLRQSHENAQVEVRSITGGLHPFNPNYDPREYLQSEYDSAPGDKQYAEQKPLGRQVILQLELNGEKENSVMPSMEVISKTLEFTLSSQKYEATRFENYTDIGAGALFVMDFKEGSLVLVWDGRQHIDINLFLFDDQKEVADSFASKFTLNTSDNLVVALRDDFPRGLGRVVNFKSDLSFQGLDSFKDRIAYVE